MAIAYVASATAEGGNSATTAAIDTTGADLLVVVVNALTVTGTMSDSKSNTWIPLTGHVGGCDSRIYYAKNPTVGTGHTFTYTHGSNFPGIAVAAFSGADLTAPFDQENGANQNAVTSLATGSVTPGTDNQVVVAGLGLGTGGSSITINGGFTIAAQRNPATGFGSAIAYLIQTTATAANPTFSWTGSANAGASIATFKAAAGGGGTVSPNLLHSNLLQSHLLTGLAR